MIEESKSRGWAAGVFGAIGITGLLLIIAFMFMWIEEDDARAAASRILNVMVVGGVGVALLLMLVFGMLIVHRSDRDMVNGMASALGAAVSSAMAKRESEWGEQRNYYVSGARPKAIRQQRNVRALIASGERMPYGMTEDEDDDRDDADLVTRLNDVELTVPKSLLKRFSLMPHPSRAMFGGKSETYGKVCDWFIAQGVLKRESNGGVRWSEQYNAQRRARWLDRLASPTEQEQE